MFTKLNLFEAIKAAKKENSRKLRFSSEISKFNY